MCCVSCFICVVFTMCLSAMIQVVNVKINLRDSKTIVDKLVLLTKDPKLATNLKLNGTSTLDKIFSSNLKSHEDLLIKGIQEDA